jgi:DNA polymerase III sliding clamp (beta) subunit (PCNA family)
MKVNRQDLVDVLALVKPGLASKEIIEQTTSFVFSGGRIFTYNDEIAVSHDTPLDIEGAVQAKEFYDLLTRYGSQEVDVSMVKDNLVIKSRGSRTELALQAEVTLPLKELGKPKGWMPLPETFAEGVGFCAFSAGKDMTKPILTCIHVHRSIIESSDNYRFTRYTMKKPGKTFADPLLIPAIAAIQLPKYKPTEVTTTKGWAHFRNEQRTVFSCRTWSGKYPDLSKHVPKKGMQVKIPSQLDEVLMRAEVLGEKDPWGTLVDLEISQGRITIKAQGATGKFEERIRAEYNGDPLHVRITSEFLRQMTGSLDEVMISDNLSTMRFDGDGFIHVCALSEPEKK